MFIESKSGGGVRERGDSGDRGTFQGELTGELAVSTINGFITGSLSNITSGLDGSEVLSTFDLTSNSCDNFGIFIHTKSGS
jgi:hypothetical protein